jgi:hypothetical protein
MHPRHIRIPGVATLFLALLVVVGTFASTAGASTTLVFQEPHRGSTFHFVDFSPSANPHGRAPRFSPGDELIFTDRLEQEGKVVGKIRVICTATQSAPLNKEINAGFVCSILAKVPGGSLAMVSPQAEPGNPNGREGAVVGGTGRYAGARGTFLDEGGSRFDTNTITLIE